MRRFAVIWILGTTPLWCEQTPTRAELMEALSNASATFARTAPGLGAREFLSQSGRRLSYLKGKNKNKDSSRIVLSDKPINHEVESAWRLSSNGVLHEVRDVKLIDAAVPVGEVRHTLTLDADSESGATKSLLEDLDRGRLEGAATDFVPILLLFGAARQANYEFHTAGRKKIANAPMWVLRYQQIAGDDVFTEFRDRSEERHAAEGEIWFRQSDLLPLRVTMSVEEVLSVGYLLRNEAEVDYTPSPFGLAPATVVHRQYLNRDLIIENKFRYTELTGRPITP